jgi:CBS domain-containing protein
MKVKDIMTSSVLTVSPDTPVAQVARLMRENQISGAPVLDEAGRVIGIVTELDLIKRHARVHFPIYLHLLDVILFLEDPRRYQDDARRVLGTTAEDIMTRRVATVTPETSVEDVATLMVEERVNPVPVLNQDGVLIGIVSHTDIVHLIEKAESGEWEEDEGG